MAEYPFLSIDTADYLADTKGFTTLQHGAYFILMLCAWRQSDCALDDDDAVLARMVGLDKRTWLKNKSMVMKPWKLCAEHKWRQARLLDERNYVEKQRSKNSAAGKASALKRKNRASTSVEFTLQQNEQQNEHKTSTPPPLPLPTLRIITPILPNNSARQPVDKSVGDLKNLDLGRFDIFDHLNDKALQLAKDSAKGWDIYNLIKVYNDGVGNRGIPEKPAAAFIAWVRRYTKGKTL